MIVIFEQMAKLLKKQRSKVILAVGGGTALIAGICVLIIFLLSPRERPLPTNITVGIYSESAIAKMEKHPTFSKTIQSKELNEKLSSSPYFIDNNREYQDYLKKYDTIKVVEPEQVPLVDDWFQAGYCALVCTNEAYDIPVNMFATQWCSDNEGNMKIVIGHEPINNDYVYSEDPSNCVQSSVVVFLPQDKVRQAENIEILFQ